AAAQAQRSVLLATLLAFALPVTRLALARAALSARALPEALHALALVFAALALLSHQLPHFLQFFEQLLLLLFALLLLGHAVDVLRAGFQILRALTCIAQQITRRLGELLVELRHLSLAALGSVLFAIEVFETALVVRELLVQIGRRPRVRFVGLLLEQALLFFFQLTPTLVDALGSLFVAAAGFLQGLAKLVELRCGRATLFLFQLLRQLAQGFFRVCKALFVESGRGGFGQTALRKLASEPLQTFVTRVP